MQVWHAPTLLDTVMFANRKAGASAGIAVTGPLAVMARDGLDGPPTVSREGYFVTTSSRELNNFRTLPELETFTKSAAHSTAAKHGNSRKSDIHQTCAETLGIGLC